MTDREERQHVIEVLKSWDGYFIGYTSDEVQEALRYAIASIETDLKYDLLYEETSGQADKSTTKNNLGVDYISRKAVQTRLKEIINEMETIFADIREREVNDSVCGLCEYDCDHGLDGYANECPGFEKDDCFKLNEKYKAEWLDISNLPSVTPQEPRWIPVSDYLPVTNDEVLVTYIVNGNHKKRYVETANCFDGEWSSVNDEYRIPNTKIEIIAWCEMPKPYKAESEDKECI